MHKTEQMKRIIVTLLMLLSAFLLAGGRNYSLDECLELAQKHGRELEQAALSLEMSRLSYSQTGLGFLPELSLGNTNTLSDGQHETVTSVEAGTVLFAGFGRVHAMKKARLTVETSRLELELARRNLNAGVVELYIRLLQDKELVSICKDRLSLLEQQETLVGRKVELKAAVRSDLLAVQADITAAKVDILDAEGDFNASRIGLCELLEIDDWRDFDVEMTDSVFPHPQSEMYSLNDLPQVHLAGIRSDIANCEMEIAKSAVWPSVQFNVGMSSAGYRFSSYLSLSVDVPVLSLFSHAKNVREKQLSCSIARSVESQTVESLDKELKTAVSDLENVYDKYQLLLTEQERYEQVLADVRQKYEYGAATYFDCQSAMSGLFQAQSQLLQIKYEYLLGQRLLEILFDAGK